MKNNFLGRILLVLLTLTTVSTSRAACIDPTTCTIAAVGLVAIGIYNAVKNPEPPLDGLQITKDQAIVEATVHDLRATKQHLKMGNYAQYNPGYGTLIRRVKEGKIKGRNGLEALYDFAPKLFAHLDNVEASIARAYVQVGADISPDFLASVYGPRTNEDNSINWNHYAKLAEEADTLYKYLWVYKN